MSTTPASTRASRLLGAFLATMLLGLAAFLASCEAESDGTTTSTAEGLDGSAILDGEQFGFAVGVTGTDLLFDQAEWLSGDAALQIARAEGAIGPDELLSDPFYISDPEEDPVRLEVDPAAEFTLLVADAEGSPVGKTISLAEFVSLWAGNEDGSAYYSGLPVQPNGSLTVRVPMTLTVVGGKVTGGIEQYMP
jgi:hypothetical protein